MPSNTLLKWLSVSIGIMALGAAGLCIYGAVDNFRDRQWGWVAFNVFLLLWNLWSMRLNAKNYLVAKQRIHEEQVESLK